MSNKFDTTHPYNIGNSKFKLTIRILPPYVAQYNAVEVRGRAVKLEFLIASSEVQLLPNKIDQIGIWRKGKPSDVVYERFPDELILIDLNHIEWIKIDVSNI